MDGDTAAVLKNSRFAQDFLFTHVGAVLPAAQSCSGLESKVCFTFSPILQTGPLKPRQAAGSAKTIVFFAAGYHPSANIAK